MSGGSYNYIYREVENIDILPTTSLRRAFSTHLRKVAKALHDIEWVDSCDYGPGDEEEAIRDCLSQGAELSQLIEEARTARDALDAAMDRATIQQGLK